MKLSYPYKSEKLFFLASGLFIIAFILLVYVYHFLISSSMAKLFLYLIIISLWAYSEYHHRVIMSSLNYKLGFTTGQIKLLKELKTKKKNYL